MPSRSWYSQICFWSVLVPALAQPRLILPETRAGLLPGQAVPPEVFVMDSEGRRVLLTEVVDEETRVVVLVLFGGAALQPPEEDFRGPLWCVDSFDDLAVQRALVEEFEDRGVQFIAVAVAPVFSTKFGYPEGVFLDEKEDSASYRKAASAFIDATLRILRGGSLLPFGDLYFDPKLLTLRTDSAPGDPNGIESWRGLFKWSEDPRKYGAPTIWVLDRDLVAQSKPFWGNEYGSSPPQVHYSYADLKAVIESALGSTQP